LGSHDVAAKYKLDNLICIVIITNSSWTDPVEMIMPIEPLADKFKSFAGMSAKSTATA